MGGCSSNGWGLKTQNSICSVPRSPKRAHFGRPMPRKPCGPQKVPQCSPMKMKSLVCTNGAERFVRISPTNFSELTADLLVYTGGAASGGFFFERLEGPYGRLRVPGNAYVEVEDESTSLTVGTADPEQAAVFEWIQRPNGDVVLRSVLRVADTLCVGNPGRIGCMPMPMMDHIRLRTLWWLALRV